ncbi:MAG: hypothetical protein IH983_00535 [Planctomycetes bacterium]|nr:hypothetical protein [Planctomycetota bacterium]
MTQTVDPFDELAALFLTEAEEPRPVDRDGHCSTVELVVVGYLGGSARLRSSAPLPDQPRVAASDRLRGGAQFGSARKVLHPLGCQQDDLGSLHEPDRHSPSPRPSLQKFPFVVGHCHRTDTSRGWLLRFCTQEPTDGHKIPRKSKDRQKFCSATLDGTAEPRDKKACVKACSNPAFVQSFETSSAVSGTT